MCDGQIKNNTKLFVSQKSEKMQRELKCKLWQKQELSHTSKTLIVKNPKKNQVMTIVKNWNFDKTTKLKKLLSSKTQNVTRLRNSNLEKLYTLTVTNLKNYFFVLQIASSIVTKLNNSNCYKNQQLKWLEISRTLTLTKINNSDCD